MIRHLIPVLALFLLAGSTGAQERAQFDLFGGYSYTHEPSTLLSGPPIVKAFASANLNGWNGSLEYKPIRWVGAVADVGGSYGGQRVTPGCEVIFPCPLPFNATARVHTVLFGPRFSMNIGKVIPFAQALLGLAHTSLTGPSNFSDTSRSWAIGGGLDYRLVKRVAWRVQADSLNTDFFGKTQNNFRLSTGIVLRF